MLLLRVLGVAYFAAVCTAQVPQNDTEGYPTTAPTTKEPPVPRLKSTSSWLDVFSAEKVQLTCEITDPSEWSFTWFLKGEKIPEPDSGLSLSSERSVLTITAAPKYAGSYTCQGVHKTKPNFVTRQSNSLTVTVQKPPTPVLSKSPNFDKMYPGESVTFTCTIMPGYKWEYVWYHGDKQIQASSAHSYTIHSLSASHRGEYKCRARRQPDGLYTKEGVTSLNITEIPVPSLRNDTEWLDVFPGESVKLSCKVEGSSDWTYRWYKDNQPIGESSATLSIDSALATNGGQYQCSGHIKDRSVNSSLSSGLSLTVYANKPKPRMTQTPDVTKLYNGETVSFDCKVEESSGWEYLWFKDGSSIAPKSSHFAINTASERDNGKYHCMATRGNKYMTEESEKRVLHISEIPVPSLRNDTEWLDVFPGESVKLSCKIEGSSDWTYRWYKDNQPIGESSATLSIDSALAANGGQYQCSGHIKDRSVNSSLSSGLSLTVYDKKPAVSLTKDPDYNMMFPGESVTFHCHINVSSGWVFEWQKDESKVKSESSNTLSKAAVEMSDNGIYKCKAKRGKHKSFDTDFSQDIDLNVEANKPKPRMVQTPDVTELYEGETVSFDCKVEESSGWEYLWFKDGSSIAPKSSHFAINTASERDNGKYHCMATRGNKYMTEESEKRVLDISEIPVPSLRKVTEWLDVFPTEPVKLRCGIEGSYDWIYTWYKDGEQIRSDSNVDSYDFTIDSASSSDRGNYSCTGKLKDRPVSSNFSSALTVSVYDTTPKVTLMQKPEHVQLMHTDDTVSFFCHNNVSSGWKYYWYKNDQPISDINSDNYTINLLSTSHSGSYKCQVRRGADFKEDSVQTLKLEVKERPHAEMALLTGWSEVFSTDTLVLQCEVKDSENMWNYTWFKDNQEISTSPSEKHFVTPQDDPEQSTYTCKGVRSERPTYSRPSEEFKTKNLLLKRRVLLSISGCIFFGIIAVFIGCIFLRVTRRPAPVAEQHEDNLFLTMAELKNRSDAPCPLAGYITEEELNAQAKEAENGTVCSETTPLPISTETDEAAATENHDKGEGNNGEMVSFKI